MVQRVVAEGHTLCNHSWDHHSPFDALALSDIDAEINRTQQAMAAAAGTTARYFRAPRAGSARRDGQVLLARQRARTIPLAWGVDSLDWKKPGVAAIVSNVLNTVTPGAVILLHDGGGDDREQTIAALPGSSPGCRPRVTPSPPCRPTRRLSNSHGPGRPAAADHDHHGGMTRLIIIRGRSGVWRPPPAPRR